MGERGQLKEEQMDESKMVLVTLPLSPQHREQIEQAAAGTATACNFVYAEEPADKQVASASVIIGMVEPERLQLATQLEWMQLSWAGAGPYCDDGILPENAVLTCASGAYGLTCSEHMLAFTFDLVRRFPAYHRNQQQHAWEPLGEISSIERSTVVVLGMGDIGGDYARKMNALGARIIGVRRTAREMPPYAQRVVTSEQLDEVLPEADIVAMALPDTPDTAGIIGARQLSLMKPGAYLMNVGRGNAIDHDALVAALREGKLAGVALDVTDPEPLPADDYLWGCERVFITPHVAGRLFLPETLNRIVALSARNLHAWLTGQPLQSVVNRALRY